MAHPPKRFRSIYWPTPIDCIDLNLDKPYVIHRVLMYSKDFHAIRWLFKAYTIETITEVFVKRPAKIYSPWAFNFMKNHLLPLKNTSLDETKYIDDTIPPRRDTLKPWHQQKYS